MSNNYSVALNEASNDYLYEDYFTLFEDTKDAARELYNLMFQYGWYTIEEAEEQKVNNKISCFETKLEELN
jgi:spore coat protein CotF